MFYFIKQLRKKELGAKCSIKSCYWKYKTKKELLSEQVTFINYYKSIKTNIK